MKRVQHTTPITRILRVLIAGAALAMTILATGLFTQVVLSNGFSISDSLLVILFTTLFFWIAINFCAVVAGFVRQLIRGQQSLDFFDRNPFDGTTYREIPVSAIVIPVYNEDAADVYAAINAMADSLEKAGYTNKFDFFVMSDSTDPEKWLREEWHLAKIREERGDTVRIHYRHRPRNTARKSGNIEDFVTRWGKLYKYMIVLDADSTMSGRTMLEMVRRMELIDNLGILQVPPVPASRRSFFARLQQFSSAMYGAVFGSGFTTWTHTGGNFFGHNAIIRIEAFAKHCKLPLLPGKPPLGGEILSHDFVEAALIRRAGYSVLTTDDLPGSYEECPTTLQDYAKRDQRWCQGNLQHFALATRPGFRWMSRLHLLIGIMAYVSSPLWLLFILVGLVNISGARPAPESDSAALGGTVILVFAWTMAMLLLPKFFSFLLLLRNPSQRSWYGGLGRAVYSVLLETFCSILLAPIMMIYHTMFVVSTLMGQKVQWLAQNRGEREAGIAESFRDYWLHAVAGAAIISWGLLAAPTTFWVFMPVALPLLFSPFLAVIFSSTGFGDMTQHQGLLLTRSEVHTPYVISRKKWHCVRLRYDEVNAQPADPIQQVIIDPVFNALHCSLLKLTPPPQEHRGSRRALCKLGVLALMGGTSRLTRDEQVRLLSDARSLQILHRRFWMGQLDVDLSSSYLDSEPSPQPARNRA